MNVYYNLRDFKKLNKAVVTTGTFDGVHIGHQSLINRLKEIAAKDNAETVVITFDPHPRVVIYNDTNIRMISTVSEKIELLEKYGIHHLIVVPFTKEFSRISSIDFIRNILVGIIGTTKLVIGYNHHFGRNREGSFSHLKEYGPVYGFEVEEISAKEIDSIDISSTKIREAVEKGDILLANTYLGYSFSLKGNVVEGKKLGRNIGFPTANIDIENTHKLLPGNGVYAVKVKIEETIFNGMMNIGVKPTVTDDGKISIEVNVFNFDGNLYTKRIEVFPVKKIREELKFSGVEFLKNQLIRDKQECLTVLS